MADDDGRSRSSGRLDPVPGDIVAVLLALLVTDLSVLAPVIRETPLRIVTGFGLLLFVPGYALVTVFFPERGSALGANDGEWVTTEGRPWSPTRRGIDGVERLVLSIALSLVIVMATALALDVAGVPLTLMTVLVALNGVVVATTVAATVRRLRLPETSRPRIRPLDRLSNVRADLTSFDRTDRVLSVVLVALILVAIGGTVYTAAVPSEEERFTEFYLLSRDVDGDLGATGYPTNFTTGKSERLLLGVENHERRPVDYTVVVELQRVDERRAGATVRSERELHRFHERIAAGETWRKPHGVTPDTSGTNLRLTYLLYRGEPPAEPTGENAYRRLHLWINVSD